jgi:hypothetical protein
MTQSRAGTTALRGRAQARPGSCTVSVNRSARRLPIQAWQPRRAANGVGALGGLTAGTRAKPGPRFFVARPAHAWLLSDDSKPTPLAGKLFTNRPTPLLAMKLAWHSGPTILEPDRWWAYWPPRPARRRAGVRQAARAPMVSRPPAPGQLHPEGISLSRRSVLAAACFQGAGSLPTSLHLSCLYEGLRGDKQPAYLFPRLP